MGRFIDVTLRFIDNFSAGMEAAVKKAQNTGKTIQKNGRQIINAGKGIESVGKGLTKNVTTPIIALGIAAAKVGIEFESAFAGVKKTLDLSGYSAGEAEKILKGLENGFIDLSTKIPVSAKEIAGIGEAAGQLGISEKNILSFTKTIADLGATTNLTYDAAASSLAQFANITGMTQTDFDRLGSTIVDLGNHFATTESSIVEMGMRIAGAGNQVGLNEAEIMGISAALSSVGIEAEMGGSAFSKAIIAMQVAAETGFSDIQNLSKLTGKSLRELELMSSNDSKGFKNMAQSLGYTQKELNAMIKAGKNLENFADISGLTAKDFKTLFEKDAAGAIEKFITGLGDVEGKGESTIKMLQDMGFTEVRLRDSLTRLANSSGNVSKAVKMGNDAWKKNDALQNEASQRYETTASKMEITKNKLIALGIKTKNILQPSIDKLIDSVDRAITWFSGLDTKTQQSIVKFAAMAAVIGPVILVFGKTVTTIGKLVLTFGKAAKAIGTFARTFNKLKEVGKVGMAFMKFGALGKAAFMALISPAGIVIALVAVIAGLAFLVIKNWKSVKPFFTTLSEGIKRIFTGMFNVIKGIANALVTIIKTPINAVSSIINTVLSGINKISVTIPKWVPLLGGKHIGFNIPKIPMLYRGTNNWGGGPAMVHDRGAEIINLPKGTQVIPHDKSLQIAAERGRRSGGGQGITISNLNIIIQSATISGNQDIKHLANELATEFVQNLKKVSCNIA